MKRSDDPLAYLRKAERTLSDARLLLSNKLAEGACNRAYYAMFHAAQAALITAGIEGPENGYKTHNGLIAAFGKHLVITGQLDETLGQSLNKVQRSRQLADYIGDPISIEEAILSVARAEVFVAAIRPLRISPSLLAA